MKTQTETDMSAAIAKFMESHGVTRCPTAAVTRTTATVPVSDRMELANRFAALEARRTAKTRRPFYREV